MMEPKTQKAKGIKVLTDNLLGVLEVPPIKFLMNKATTLAEMQMVWPVIMTRNYWNDPETIQVFARPCPLRPRHGFVDSREVKSPEDAMAVLAQTLLVEPEGEVMLMHRIPAEFSGIITPALFTIGEKHDGATMGTNTVNFPLVQMPTGFTKAMYEKAGVGKDEHPYVEVLLREYRTYAVQLRAGPKMTSVDPDFIPYEVVVDNIVAAGGDLLEWETAVLAMKRGTVVYHPGGSLADHFYVHARASNIPVLTTREPRLGETLVPRGDVAKIDPDVVLKGAIAAFDQNRLTKPDHESPGHGHYAHHCYLILEALHNSAAMTGPNSWWIGFAAGTAVRLGMMGLRGEHRHYSGRGSSQRDVVYHSRQGDGLEKILADLPLMFTRFRYGRWTAGGGFGGPKWAACALTVFQVAQSIVHLAKDTSLANANAMLRGLNNLIHQEHNGGWWFNKFVDQEVMNNIAGLEPADLIRSMPALYRAGRTYASITDWSARRDHYASLDARLDLEPKKSMGLKPTIDYIPFSGMVRVQLEGGAVGEPGGKPIPMEISGNLATRRSFVADLTLTSGELKGSIKDGRLTVLNKDGLPYWQDDELKIIEKKLKTKAQAKKLKEAEPDEIPF